MNKEVIKPKHMTWDDLADFYKSKTGCSARIRPMKDVYNWALKQPEFKETEEGLILIGGVLDG